MNLIKSPAIRRNARIETKDCGIAQSAHIFGDKWVLLILREAFYAVVRFDDMQKDIGIPRAILSNRLGRLIDQGLMLKQPYQEPSARIRHSYHLTSKGKKAALILLSMMEWGNEFLLNHPPLLNAVDAKSKKTLRLGLIDSDGKEIGLKQVALEPNNK